MGRRQGRRGVRSGRRRLEAAPGCRSRGWRRRGCSGSMASTSAMILSRSASRLLPKSLVSRVAMRSSSASSGTLSSTTARNSGSNRPWLATQATSDKEVLVRGSRLGEQRVHPGLVPQRLAPAVRLRRLDDPAVLIGVHHPMPASGELSQHGRASRPGHPRHQHRRHPPPPPSRACPVSNVYVRSWHCAHEVSWAQ